MLGTRHHEIRVIEQMFEAQLFVRNGAPPACDEKINISREKLALQLLRCFRAHETKYHARIAPRNPFDDSGDEARGMMVAASDPNFPGLRIGEELDVPYSLAQVIKHRNSTVKQSATVSGRLDAVRVAIQQRHTDGIF